MTYNVLMGTLNPTHSLTHSLTEAGWGCGMSASCTVDPLPVRVDIGWLHKLLERPAPSAEAC